MPASAPRAGRPEGSCLTAAHRRPSGSCDVTGQRTVVLRVLIPLRSSNGSLWHTIEREMEVEIPPTDETTLTIRAPFAVDGLWVECAAVVSLAEVLEIP